MEPSDPWANLIAAAHKQVERARQGDVGAAKDVLSQAIIAIRSILAFESPDHEGARLNVLDDWSESRRLAFNEAPDPLRLVYLRSVLASLVAIERGETPEQALHLSNPYHRPATPELEVRDVLMFVQVGTLLDKLTASGRTRQDRPTDDAVAQVAKQFNCSRDTVKKAWGKHGASKGWERQRSEWK